MAVARMFLSTCQLGIIFKIICFTHLFASSFAYLSADSVLTQEVYGSTNYYLNMRQYKYNWQEALQSCSDRNTRIARAPIPSFITGRFSEVVSRDIDTNIWIANSNSNCMTLKKRCKPGELRALFGGQSRCGEYEFNPENTDCSSARMLYVICETIPLTTPTTTTTTTTTTTPAPTTTTTTTTPAPTTTQKQTRPAFMTRGRFTTGSVFRYNTMSRSTKKSQYETSSKRTTGEELARKTGTLLIAVATADKHLLGLIVAVVTGVFFITSLIICICCACQGKSKSKRRKKYELIHGYSSNTMDRGHRTDTTEETSIEENDGSFSDGRSHSMRHDDAYDGMVFPTILPPPPLLHEQPSMTTASVYDVRPPTSLQNTMQSRRYNTMNGRMPINAIDNDIYASINKQRKPSRQNIMSHSMRHHQEVPLPPPPPPIKQQQLSPALGLSDTESESRRPYRPRERDSSQSRSDTGTINSSRSGRSKRSKRVRHSPQPTTITPSGNRRAYKNSSRRDLESQENIDLVSTNL